MDKDADIGHSEIADSLWPGAGGFDSGKGRVWHLNPFTEFDGLPPCQEFGRVFGYAVLDEIVSDTMLGVAQ
jgi:hypothetical protein